MNATSKETKREQSGSPKILAEGSVKDRYFYTFQKTFNSSHLSLVQMI